MFLWDVHRLRYHPFDSILLQVIQLRQRRRRCGDVALGVLARCVLTAVAVQCCPERTSIDIEKELGVEPPPLLREHPTATLYDASKLLIQTHARRVPLLDHDSETGHEVIISVLTQYRLLKFISINVRVNPCEGPITPANSSWLPV